MKKKKWNAFITTLKMKNALFKQRLPVLHLVLKAIPLPTF